VYIVPDSYVLVASVLYQPAVLWEQYLRYAAAHAAVHVQREWQNKHW
jgi:hypothetical protein